MRKLLVYATSSEAGLPETPAGTIINHSPSTDILIAGIGSMATAYWMGRHLMQNKYELAINAGICGAFNRHIALGQTVNITCDCFADLGAEDDETLLDVFEIGLAHKDQFPFSNGKLNATSDVRIDLPAVTAITVNRSTGNEVTMKKLVNKYNADVESLEGAAFFYACAMNKIPSIQIRAVSNYVERRNRALWKIDQAIKSLSHTVQQLIVL